MITLTVYNRNGKWVDSTNAMTAETPCVCVAMSVAMGIKFFVSDNSDTAMDLSNYTFKFYADADFDHLTSPKIETESGITYNATTRVATIPMEVGSAVQQWLGTASKGELIGELQCWRSGEQYADLVLQFRFGVFNRVKIA